MQQAVVEIAAKPGVASHVRLRPIALPNEHGGWGMLGAPILLGLLVAPSWAGVLLGLAGAAAFLTRQPFRLAISDLKKGKRYPRTAWAIRFASGYAALGAAALILAANLSQRAFWLPLGISLLLGGVQFGYDIQTKGRSFIPELCGAAALSFLTTAIALSGGLWGSKPWLMALATGLQAGTAIAYAGARVRLARGVPIHRSWIWLGHLAALALAGSAVGSGWAGWPAGAAFAVLAIRAFWGLSPLRRDVRAATVGIQEVGYTVLTVVLVAISIR